MKLLIGLSLALSASMKPVPKEHVTYQRCMPFIGQSCLYDTPLTCPPGYLDGCITGESSEHQCLSVAQGPSCELEMSLICPENFQDGCITGETEIHSCVPVKGKLCKESSELSCPSGFVDSCLK